MRLFRNMGLSLSPAILIAGVDSLAKRGLLKGRCEPRSASSWFDFTEYKQRPTARSALSSACSRAVSWANASLARVVPIATHNSTLRAKFHGKQQVIHTVALVQGVPRPGVQCTNDQGEPRYSRIILRIFLEHKWFSSLIADQ